MARCRGTSGVGHRSGTPSRARLPRGLNGAHPRGDRPAARPGRPAGLQHHTGVDSRLRIGAAAPPGHGSMQPLRYYINVTLDGCCDHRAMIPDEALHRHAVEAVARAGALIFGRVTYQMMEAAWRPPAQPGTRPEWMEPFARTINAGKKYVVSSTLE